MTKVTIKLTCNKCGELPQINEAMSNKNWTAYNTKNPCKCGGKYSFTTITK